MNNRPRPHMPVTVQRDACLHLLGLDPADVEWDHCPALRLRAFDPETGEYTPAANDPKHIRPRTKVDHKDKTKGDAKQIAAMKRGARAMDEKVARQEKARELQEAILRGEPIEKDMRPAEKRKPKIRGPKLRRKHENGQKSATRPLKTASRFR